jgi:TusA-related sulfurtransferase
MPHMTKTCPASSRQAILVDVRGLRCPLPVLRLAKALRAQEPDAWLQVLLNDQQTYDEICAFAKLRGLDLKTLKILEQAFTREWLLEIVR